MTPEDKQALDDTVKQIADCIDEFKHTSRDALRNSMPVRVNVNAGGYGTTLTLLILLSIILGFAYTRIQTRIDGLYDRMDVIYMQAPALQHQIISQEKPHEQRSDHP